MIGLLRGIKGDSQDRLLTVYGRDTQGNSTPPDIYDGRHDILGINAGSKGIKEIQTQSYATTNDSPIGYLNSDRCLGRTRG